MENILLLGLYWAAGLSGQVTQFIWVFQGFIGFTGLAGVVWGSGVRGGACMRHVV